MVRDNFMHYGFWGQLKKPFFVLAPMANVTDTVFRQIIVQHGKPDAVWTEFVATDGLCSEGREMLLRDLQFTEGERPIVAQIFGATPVHFFESAKLLAELGFDGVDINMGCPDKNVLRQGAGASLIKTPELAQEIIRATQEGVRASGREIPVSVKTRLGFYKDEIDSWIPKILAMNIPVLTVHARTKKEMSKTPARWEKIREIVVLAKGTGTLIIGNGDVKSLSEAKERFAETGIDGVMLGRAIFGNPWLFDTSGKVPILEEKLKAMIEHTHLFEQTWGENKSFELMKKHYKAYVNGFDGAKALRVQLMECHSAKAIEEKVTAFLEKSF
jgi:nifR3 family TIM-barrel protein